MSTIIMVTIGVWITTLTMNFVYSVRECGRVLKIRQPMALRIDSSSAEAISSLEVSRGRGVANVGGRALSCNL